MTGLMKVRFTSNAVYRVHGYVHPDNPVFKAGSEHEMSEDQAARWLKRGVAEVSVTKPLPKTEAQAEAKHGDELSAKTSAAAPKADGVGSGNEPDTDKRNAGKTVARHFRRDK